MSSVRLRLVVYPCTGIMVVSSIYFQEPDHLAPSQQEHKAMGDYNKEALQQGYIAPSTSSTSAGFFFVEKKGGASIILGPLYP